MAPSSTGRATWWLAAAAISCGMAAPPAQADALAEVRIVQVQVAPDGSATEIGAPLVVRSFSDGVAQADIEFYGVPVAVGPGQTQSWDFAYSVSMRADGLPFAGDAPPVCAGLTGGPCSPPIGGQSLAWTFFTIGEVDPRTMLPWAQLSGGERFQFTLRDGSFEQSGLLHLEAGSSSTFSGWSGAFTVGAVTFAAAIPEPATYAQMGIGLALVGGVLARRRRRWHADDRLSAAPPPAA